MAPKKKAQVWILNEDKECLLLQTTALRGGFWQPVTGSVEEGESFLEAAHRELKEETGFTGPVQPIGYIYNFLKGQARFEEEVFRVVLATPLSARRPTPTLDPREHIGFEWVPLRQALESRLKFPQYREILRLLGAP